MSITMCGPGCRPSGNAPCADPRVTHEGRVLYTFERNGYHDSDFLAVVLTEDGTLETTEYATTRFWSYHNSAEVDASPEVRAEAEEAFAKVLFSLMRDHYAAELAQPMIGDTVESITTRGKNVDLAGEVKWIGPQEHNRYGLPKPRRIGIGVPGERGYRFIGADRVRVTRTDREMPDDESIMREARARAKGSNFRLH